MPLKGLADLGVHFRKGQLSLMAAGPGGGKTALLHALLHHGVKGDKPSTLYFSADSGPNVIWKRSAALASKLPQSEIEQMEREGRLDEVERKMILSGSHIQWDFTSSLSPEHILAQLDAYVELHDSYPDVLVVDNLKDLADENDGEEFRALEDTLVWLKNLAARTGIAAITLHHVGGPHEDGNHPIPLSGLRGKLGKTPALVLTLHRPDPSEMRVSVVKHRDGRVDTSGLLFARVKVDLGTMSFTG